jgi:hypothetical protein
MPGTVIQTSIIGVALVEILNGELSDETIMAIGSIKYRDVPPPLNHLVGYIQGMNMDPNLRRSIVRDLNDEIRIIAEEQKEKLK